MNAPHDSAATQPREIDARVTSPDCPTEAAGASNRLTFTWRTEDCDECQGDGFVHEIAHVTGEAIDADVIAVECVDCGGTGTVDASCADCLKGAPLDAEGFCAECVLTTVAPGPGGVL